MTVRPALYAMYCIHMSYAIIRIKPLLTCVSLHYVQRSLVKLYRALCCSVCKPAESVWPLMAEQQAGQQEPVTAPSNALPHTTPGGTSQLETRSAGFMTNVQFSMHPVG